MNEQQKAIFMKIKEAVCNSVECYPVLEDAVRIDTPFLDWMGEYIGIYVTKNGRITDGDQILNQIDALGSYKEFIKWDERNDFLYNYNINQKDRSLDPCYFETQDDILKYIQGISRLPGLFEAKPLGEKQDRFPTLVKKIVTDTLINDCPQWPREGVADWASRLTQPRSFRANNVIIHSDLSPIDENKIVEIIGYQSSNDSEKRSHVKDKLFDPMLWGKYNQRVETIAVTFDIFDYPSDSRDLLSSQAEVIELKKPNARMQLANMLLATASSAN
jgi:hypothetical protein